MAYSSRLSEMRHDNDCTDLKLITCGQITPVHKCVVSAAFPFCDKILTSQSIDSLDVTRWFEHPDITDLLIEYVYEQERIFHQQRYMNILSSVDGPLVVKLIAKLRYEIPILSKLLKEIERAIIERLLIIPENYLAYMRLAQHIHPELSMAAWTLTDAAIVDSSSAIVLEDQEPSSFKNMIVIHRKSGRYLNNNVILVDLETMRTYTFNLKKATHLGKKRVEILAVGIDHFWDKTVLVVAYNDTVYEKNAVILKYFLEHRTYFSPIPPIHLDFNSDPYMYTGLGDDNWLSYIGIKLKCKENGPDEVTCYCNRLKGDSNTWHTLSSTFLTSPNFFQQQAAILCQFIINYSPTKTLAVATTKCCMLIFVIEPGTEIVLLGENDELIGDELHIGFTSVKFDFDLEPDVASNIRYATCNSGDVLFCIANQRWFIFRNHNTLERIDNGINLDPNFLCSGAGGDKLYYLCNPELCETGPHLLSVPITADWNKSGRIQSILHLGHEEIWTNEDTLRCCIMSGHANLIEQIDAYDCDSDNEFLVKCGVQRNTNPDFGKVILKEVRHCKAGGSTVEM